MPPAEPFWDPSTYLTEKFPSPLPARWSVVANGYSSHWSFGVGFGIVAQAMSFAASFFFQSVPW
nr:hypothetical protein [Amycolatopsis decaplanina]